MGEPLPILMGVKSLDDGPLGAFSRESMPFPGRTTSAAVSLGGARRMDPIV